MRIQSKQDKNDNTYYYIVDTSRRWDLGIHYDIAKARARIAEEQAAIDAPAKPNTLDWNDGTPDDDDRWEPCRQMDYNLQLSLLDEDRS